MPLPCGAIFLPNIILPFPYATIYVPSFPFSLLFSFSFCFFFFFLNSLYTLICGIQSNWNWDQLIRFLTFEFCNFYCDFLIIYLIVQLQIYICIYILVSLIIVYKYVFFIIYYRDGNCQKLNDEYLRNRFHRFVMFKVQQMSEKKLYMKFWGVIVKRRF